MENVENPINQRAQRAQERLKQLRQTVVPQLESQTSPKPPDESQAEEERKTDESINDETTKNTQSDEQFRKAEPPIEPPAPASSADVTADTEEGEDVDLDAVADVDDVFSSDEHSGAPDARPPAATNQDNFLRGGEEEINIGLLKNDLDLKRKQYCKHLFGKNIFARQFARFVGRENLSNKKSYIQAKVAYATGLYNQKCSEGLSDEAISAAILEDAIINERQAFSDVKKEVLEGKEKNAVIELSTKLLNWYRGQDQWKRILGSTVLVTGAVAVAPYLPVIGGSAAGFLSVQTAALFAGGRVWRGLISSLPAHFVGLPVYRLVDKISSSGITENKEKRTLKLKSNFTSLIETKTFEKALKKGERKYKHIQWKEGRGKFYQKAAPAAVVLGLGFGIAGVDQVWGVGGQIHHPVGGAIPHRGGADATNAIESLSKAKGMKELLKVVKVTGEYTEVHDASSLSQLFSLNPNSSTDLQLIERLAELAKRGRISTQEFENLVHKARLATVNDPFTIEDINSEVLFKINNKADFLDYLEEKYPKSVHEFKNNIIEVQGNIFDSKEQLYYFVDPENGKWIGVDNQGNPFEMTPSPKKASLPNPFVSEADAAETMQIKPLKLEELSQEAKDQLKQIQEQQRRVSGSSEQTSQPTPKDASTQTNQPPSEQSKPDGSQLSQSQPKIDTSTSKNGETMPTKGQESVQSLPLTVDKNSWFNKIELPEAKKNVVLTKMINLHKEAFPREDVSFNKVQTFFETKLNIKNASDPLFKHLLFHINNSNLSPKEWADLLKESWSDSNQLTIEAIDKLVFSGIGSQEEMVSFLRLKFPDLYQQSLTDHSFSFKDGHISRDGYEGMYTIDPATQDLLWSGGKAANGVTSGQMRLRVGQTTWEKGEVSVAAAATGGTASKIELPIGRRGPEGAIIDYFRDNNLVAKQFGWDGNEDIDRWAGRKAHRMWLAQAEEARKPGGAPYNFGDETSMRRIASGKVVIEADASNPEGGKIGFSDDTKILPPRTINHTSISAAPRPVAPSPSVIERPTSGTPTPLSTTVAIENPRAVAADRLLDQAKIPAEYHFGLKETLVKDIAEKGNANSASNEGKILADLKNYFNYESLTDTKNHGWKKLKDLFESMVDDKGNLIVRSI